MGEVKDNKKILYAVGMALIFAYLGRVAMKKSRGLRNNNPGNIKELPGDSTQWLGERATDDDPVFEEFEAPGYGIRAIGKILDSYQRRGVITVRQIIETWAPGEENNTESYIASVVSQTGYPENFIPLREEGNFVPLIAAIIKHENGLNPFSDEQIRSALAMA